MSGGAGRSAGALSRILRVAGVAVAIAILVFVVVAARPGEVWNALKEVEGGKPWAVIGLNVVVVALFTARSRLLLARMGHVVPLRILVPVSVLGNVAGALTPGGSGEVLRAAALQRSSGLRLGEAVTLVAYERVLSTYLLLLSTLACLAIAGLPVLVAAAAVLSCCVFVLLPWLCAVALLPRLPAAASIDGGGLPRTALRYGLQLANEIQSLLRSPGLLVAWSALTVASFAVVAWQFQLVAASLGVPIDVVDGWIAFGGSGVASILSVLPLGLGVGDGSIAAIIHQIGDVPFQRATATAVLIRATVTLPLILLAVLSYLYLLRVAPPSAPLTQGEGGRLPGDG